MSGYYAAAGAGAASSGGVGSTAVAVTWANGNHTSATSEFAGYSEATVTGPTGAVTLKSIAAPAGGAGVLRLVLNYNQQTTIKNVLGGETAGTKIQTPTGADVVIAAPGAGQLAVVTFRYDAAVDTNAGGWIMVEN